MLNISNQTIFNKTLFVQYIKQCSELGVDLIKIPIPTDVNNKDEDIKNFILHSPPLLFSGGNNSENFIEEIKTIKARLF